ncbi:MAG: MBL fold metallo-hydrolase [Planctomycetota bacterium]|jgi:glyoxylase-like metal-dependent hydrolase (beta-lactamase superfamily II)
MENTFSVQQITSRPCFSYLLESNGQALLIDPHITKAAFYRDLIRKKGLTLAGIVDTHTHADHISSAAILKAEYPCPLYMSSKAISSLGPKQVSAGDTIEFGSGHLEVWDAPGHTDDSIALVGDGCVFTGDVLMIGSVGRTDFQNGSPADMFNTLARFKELPDDTVVYPAHDYKGHKQSTIAQEKTQNPFMVETDKQAFIANAESKVLAKPFNMDQIIQVNREGSAKEIEFITAQQVKERLDAGGWEILDVRRPDEYQGVRVMPSVNIPLDSLTAQMGQLADDKQWIVSCRSGNRATTAGGMLLAAGIQNFCVAKDSLNGWLKQKYPVIREKLPVSLERQVRTVAGSLVAVGTLLAIFVSKWFLILPLFVGCGLVFAGITDSCMMGELLMKLPYNKKAMQKKAAGGACSLDSGSCSMGGDTSSGGSCAM